MAKRKTRGKDKIEAKAKKAVILAHKRTLDVLRGKLGEFFSKYEKNGTLDFKEAVKYKRLRGLEEEVTEKLRELGTNVKRIESCCAKKAYIEKYFETGYNIEMATLKDLKYKYPKRDVVTGCVESEITGCKISERFLKKAVNNVFKTKEILKRGLIAGKGYASISSEIKKELGKESFEAVRIVQTELHRVSMEGKLASMEHAAETLQEEGIKIKKVWVASMDKRTRDTHSDLDGTEVDIGDDFEWEGQDGSHVCAEVPGLSGNAGEDINCRCSVVERVEGLEAVKRRDAKGNTIEYASRKEWMKEHGYKVRI